MGNEKRGEKRSKRKVVQTDRPAPTSVPGSSQAGGTNAAQPMNAVTPASVALVPASDPTVASPNERAWKIAQLAATLASSVQILENSSVTSNRGPRIASAAMDPYYAAAMKRAEAMLDWAEGKWGDIHAYQFFSEGEILTEDDILAVFSRFGWAGLKSKQPVIDLMANTREQFDNNLRRHETLDELGSSSSVIDLIQTLETAIDRSFGRWLGRHDQGDAYTKSVRKEVHGLFKAQITGLKTKLPQIIMARFLAAVEVAAPELEQEGDTDLETFRRFVGELKCALTEQAQGLFPSGGGLERLYAQLDRAKFFDWCFPSPAAIARRADRIYRPYEIFLRCAENNWCREKLIAHASTLKIDCVPGSVVDLRHPTYEAFMQNLDC